MFRIPLFRIPLFRITVEALGGSPPPPRPRQPSLGEKLEIPLARFVLNFSFQPPLAIDVVQRELSITVNGGDPPQVRTYPSSPAVPALLSDRWVFNDLDKLTL